MDHKLLPCPCCGSTDLNADKVSDTLVYCMGCGLRAINTERWNTRANRPADDGLACPTCGEVGTPEPCVCSDGYHAPGKTYWPADDGLVEREFAYGSALASTTGDGPWEFVARDAAASILRLCAALRAQSQSPADDGLAAACKNCGFLPESTD